MGRRIYNPRLMRWENEDGTPVEDEAPRFTFGIHKDLSVKEVPKAYLAFCLRELKHLDSNFRDAVAKELRRR